MSEKEMSFEEMLRRLEEIVRALDSVETPLDTSLTLFEEGANLVRRCTKILDDAQQKVVLLTACADSVTEEKMDGDAQ